MCPFIPSKCPKAGGKKNWEGEEGGMKLRGYGPSASLCRRKHSGHAPSVTDRCCTISSRLFSSGIYDEGRNPNEKKTKAKGPSTCQGRASSPPCTLMNVSDDGTHKHTFTRSLRDGAGKRKEKKSERPTSYGNSLRKNGVLEWV